MKTRRDVRLVAIRTLYDQKSTYDNINQPFLRPTVHGKTGKPVEFGAKLDISVVEGWRRLECFPLMRTTRQEICRPWWSAFGNGEGTTPAGYWSTRFIEIETICTFARSAGFI